MGTQNKDLRKTTAKGKGTEGVQPQIHTLQTERGKQHGQRHLLVKREQDT